jgi:hypothetical protein
VGRRRAGGGGGGGGLREFVAEARAACVGRWLCRSDG